jgi:hypothetical protein
MKIGGKENKMCLVFQSTNEEFVITTTKIGERFNHHIEYHGARNKIYNYEDINKIDMSAFRDEIQPVIVEYARSHEKELKESGSTSIESKFNPQEKIK